MRFAVGLIAVLSLLGSAHVADADWLNPRSFQDCREGLVPLETQKKAAGRRANQCYHSIYLKPHSASHAFGEVCYIGKRALRNYDICTEHTQSVCDADQLIRERRITCEARLEEYRRFTRAQEEQRRELERLARENGQSAVGQAVQERYGFLPDGPGRLVSDTQLAGTSVARMMGVRMTGDQSAYTLSNAMTRVGGRIVGRLNQRALGDLDASLQQFGAGNPRPTAAQREAYYAQRDRLAGQYATHMTRVQNTQYNLPLRDKSAVVGAYAGTIAQLVQLRNSGDIDEPIAALGAVAATYLAVRAYRDAEKRVRAQQARNAPRVVAPEQLRARRQAVLAPVAAKRAQAAAVVRAEQERRRKQAELDALARQLELDAQRMARDQANFEREQERLRRERLRRERERQQNINTAIGILGGIVQGLNGQTPGATYTCPADQMRQCGRCSCELGRGGP
ncbi:hypothetical protein [uncultured Roseobacter sp.]|uniref:hypothetical protein n=1 Tax=uncultured Roseobacter sp. TaxID=114847 RepID=UPI00261C50D2|nr:hypothetical protein [uncultured Roseobacter sp.]